MLTVLFPGLVPNKHKSTYTWLETDRYAQELIWQAEEHLGSDLLSRHVDAEIYDWNVYQAVYLIESLSLVNAWCRRRHTEADIIAGQSFGSLAAAIYSGSISFNDMCKVMIASTAAEIEYFKLSESPLSCVFFGRCSPAKTDQIIEDITSAEASGWLDVSVVQERGVMAVSGTRHLVHSFATRLKQTGGIVFYIIDRAEHCPALAPLADILRREAYVTQLFTDPTKPLISDNGVLLHTGEDVARDLADGWGRRLINQEQYNALEMLGTEHLVIPGHSSLFDSEEGLSCPKTLIKARTMLREQTNASYER